AENGDIRLLGGRVPSEGRVEVNINGTWGTVCDDSWDNSDALVVCRMLGYSDGIAYRKAKFGEGSGPIWLDDVQCDETEYNIEDCLQNTHGEHNCDHSSDAGVQCRHVAVRLVGSDNEDEGRVEVLFNGEWGSVCNTNWDHNDALIVCRMLGYNDALIKANQEFWPSSGRIWLEGLRCSGTEDFIGQCQAEPWGVHNCTHLDDAALKCMNIAVRLTGSENKSKGRVEVFYNGEWGTVCDDYWDHKDAMVVCRMLGYSDGIAYTKGKYGRGSGRIWLDNMNCTGNEPSVAKCQKGPWGEHDCKHSEDAAVECKNISVRLVGGNSSSDGHVEVYFNGQWGTIYDSNWNHNDAVVVCRMLGYSDGIGFQVLRPLLAFEPLWLDYVDCIGSELSIAECNRSEWRSHHQIYNERVGAQCRNISVRLKDGESPGNGRVEVFFNGEWGTVCDDNWNNNNALVICRMLGYSNAAAYGKAHFGAGTGRIWLDNVNCTGSESSLSECRSNRWGQHDCEHTEDAAVNCTTIVARVQGSDIDGVGRVELFYNGHWGSVCNKSWDRNDALVICRMLGYSDGHAISGKRFGKGSGKVWLDDVQCDGSESSIEECTTETWKEHTCQVEDYAAVNCSHISVRLVDGLNSSEGRVEVFFDGQWGTVCDDQWDRNDALVVCRMLGYSDAVAFSKGSFGEGIGKVWLENIHCNGNESSIGECVDIWGSSQCHHWEDAGVRCSNVSVRLVGGNNESNGRVEVFYNKEWGTICSDEWDFYDALVICRMLGYSDGVPYHGDNFGKGYGPVWLGNVKCSGNERSIADCSSSHASVRLIDGYSSESGLIEFRYNDVWGKICNDSWGIRETLVVCRMLGFSDGGVYIYPHDVNDTTVWLDDVSCSGRERSIAECGMTIRQKDKCFTGYASIYCQNVSVRVVNGPNKASGYVELLYSGVWASICSENWDRNDALVICRMMGYNDASVKKKKKIKLATEQMWLGNVECTGNENSITECKHSDWGFPCSYEAADLYCRNISVKLTDGQIPSEGRVEVFYNNTWGTVCDDNWKEENAQVICRMLGYSYGLSYTHAAYGEGQGKIWLDEVNCNGEEFSIADCKKNEWGQHDCAHREDLGVHCKNVEVRLAGGDSPRNGRVEVKFNEQWGTICDDGWDDKDAVVVCRMLGYSDGIAYKNAKYGPGSGPIWLHDVNCNGSEYSIAHCHRPGWNSSKCQHAQDAGVFCKEVAIKLLGSMVPGLGRVEIGIAGEWGTVCEDYWDRSDALVVCRMLGYHDAVAYTNGKFGRGNNSIFLDQVECLGNEYSVANCSHSTWGKSHCKNPGAAGVHCLNVTTRLVDGTNSSNGRVEVFYNGAWGTVCERGWDRRDALVICRMLGFSDATTKPSGTYKAGFGSIWVDEANCTGSEQSIADCTGNIWGTTECNHKQDVGIACSNLTVRLVAGKSSGEGRVEVFFNGKWGTVCDDGWNENSALVVCRMLGYNDAIYHGKAKYGPGTGPIWIDNLKCSGNENYITDCQFNDWGNTDCNHDEDAGVMCRNISVRLMEENNPGSNKGRVEVFFNDSWGTVCDEGWDDIDALVVCQALGFNVGVAYGEAKFGKGNGRVWLSDVQCRGHEKSITECKKNSWGINNCKHDQDAAVECSQLRLTGGNNHVSGNVEIDFNNQWGSICDNGWTDKEAHVVCRMLGYSDGVAFVNSNFGQIFHKVWLDNVKCVGTETSLTQCHRSNWGDTQCSNNHAAGVQCGIVEGRLVGGKSPREGRIEFKYAGIWGTVCNNNWDQYDAHVVCRMLGYSTGQAITDGRFGPGSGWVWLENVNCTGNEPSITLCDKSNWKSTNCDHSKDAGLKCEFMG
ncbi:scavenger receptor cysteine-rich type 1 protein M130-like, partial [Argonauta hians]